EPTTAALIGNLRRRPSATPFWFATFVSGLWLVACAAYLWGFYAPEIAKGNDLGQLIAAPEIATILIMTILPVSLVFAITYMVWRAQQMKHIAEALGQTAVRLIRPEEIAADGVASVGQAVRREVSELIGGVEHAISRAGELEALVHKELSALERAFGGNEE